MGLPNHKFRGCQIIKHVRTCVLGRLGVWVLELVQTNFLGGLPDPKFWGCQIMKNARICVLGGSKLWVLG